MKRFLLVALLIIITLTMVAGPFTVYQTTSGLSINTVETALADNHKTGLGDPAPLEKDKVKKAPVDTGACGFLSLLNCLSRTIVYIANTIFSSLGWVLGVVGSMFDSVIKETVTQMGQNLQDDEGNTIAAITLGWTTFRDLANIIIIFAFLAIGIGTILQLQSYNIGKLLPTLIIVALLVNFSLFFTRAIIDGGNLLAHRFYQQIQTDCAPKLKKAKGGAAENCGVASQFMNALSLQTLYSIDTKTGVVSSTEIKVLGNTAKTQIRFSDSTLITISLMGSFLFIVTIFVFLSAIVLLVMRFVMLIFLMVLAPLAFVAMAIPHLQNHAKEWWKLLISYTIFAPIYLILIWFVLQIVTGFGDTMFKGKIKSFASTVDPQSGVIATDNFLIFLNFIIATGFMLAALFIAKQLGIKGAETAVALGKKLSKNAAGFAGANTIGRAGGALGRGYASLQERMTSTKTGRFLRGATSVATLGLASDASIRGALKSVEEAKFGGTKSATQMREDNRKRTQELGSLGTRRRAVSESKAGTPTAQATVGSLGKQDLESMGVPHLSEPAFAANLSGSQFEDIMKSDKFSPTEKQRFRAAREQGLFAKLKAGDVKSVMRGSPADIAKLPRNILLDHRVIKHLTPQILGKIFTDSSIGDTDRKTIRGQIEFAANIGTNPTNAQKASAAWFKKSPGEFF